MRSGREIRAIVENARSFTNGSKAYDMALDDNADDLYYSKDKYNTVQPEV